MRKKSLNNEPLCGKEMLADMIYEANLELGIENSEIRKPKTYRFFYHYNKQNKKMTVHYRGICYLVKDIDCQVPCNSKWNKTQPNLVMQGFAKEVIINKDRATIC